MQLNDRLKICFIAITNRYPDCVVELEESVLRLSSTWEEGCSPERALKLLQIQAPDLLGVPARVLIDNQKSVSVIYLVDQSGEYTIFHLYCGVCFRTQKRKHFLYESSQSIPFITVH